MSGGCGGRQYLSVHTCAWHLYPWENLISWVRQLGAIKVVFSKMVSSYGGALISFYSFPLVLRRFHSLFQSMLAIVCPTRHFATLELILPFIHVFSCTSSDSYHLWWYQISQLSSSLFFRSSLTHRKCVRYTLQLAQMISSLHKKKSLCFDESTRKMVESVVPSK